MALDRDGTSWLVVNPGGGVTDVSAANVIKMSNENEDGFDLAGIGEYDRYLALIFPEKRDVDAIFIKAQYSLSTIETSTNTTNGQDGTWSTVPGPYTINSAVSAWRTALMAETILAVKAVRFRLGGSAPWPPSVSVLHIWGEIAPAETPDRLVFWNAGSDTKMDPVTLDYGDAPRSSSADRVVRVKNISPTKSAVNVRVSFDILTDATAPAPSVPAQFTASYNGGSFLAQVNIGTLAPGAISGPITLRRITPSNAQYGLFAPRVSAVADSWT
jgi:hypothetical protein